MRCRDLEDSASLDESVENLDRGSLASFGSGNTTDSDKVPLILITAEPISSYWWMKWTKAKLLYKWLGSSTLDNVAAEKKINRLKINVRFCLFVGIYFNYLVVPTCFYLKKTVKRFRLRLGDFRGDTLGPFFSIVLLSLWVVVSQYDAKYKYWKQSDQ